MEDINKIRAAALDLNLPSGELKKNGFLDESKEKICKEKAESLLYEQVSLLLFVSRYQEIPEVIFFFSNDRSEDLLINDLKEAFGKIANRFAKDSKKWITPMNRIR